MFCFVCGVFSFVCGVFRHYMCFWTNHKQRSTNEAQSYHSYDYICFMLFAVWFCFFLGVQTLFLDMLLAGHITHTHAYVRFVLFVFCSELRSRRARRWRVTLYWLMNTYVSFCSYCVLFVVCSDACSRRAVGGAHRCMDGAAQESWRWQPAAFARWICYRDDTWSCLRSQRLVYIASMNSSSISYRVAKTHNMPFLCRSFSFKEPYN